MGWRARWPCGQKDALCLLSSPHLHALTLLQAGEGVAGGSRARIEGSLPQDAIGEFLGASPTLVEGAMVQLDSDDDTEPLSKVQAKIKKDSLEAALLPSVTPPPFPTLNSLLLRCCPSSALRYPDPRVKSCRTCRDKRGGVRRESDPNL